MNDNGKQLIKALKQYIKEIEKGKLRLLEVTFEQILTERVWNDMIEFDETGVYMITMKVKSIK